MMPAFEQWPKEAAIVARLLGGYGELEFMMGVCLGRALNDFKKSMRILFRTRGETARIELADALTGDFARENGLYDKYSDALGGIRACKNIRNQFSHCHWATTVHGLFYVDLNAAADAGDKFEYKWKHASLSSLEEMESYFRYTHNCFLHVESELHARRGGPALLAFPMPSKRQPPGPPVPLAADILSHLPRGL